jgi:hypothetical protein
MGTALIRRKAQTAVLGALVAALLFAVVMAYRTQLMQTPHNLEGHSTVEGGMTANPPAGGF